MPPKRSARLSARRGRPAGGATGRDAGPSTTGPSTTATPDIGQMISEKVAEQIAAAIPIIVAQLRGTPVQGPNIAGAAVHVDRSDASAREDSDVGGATPGGVVANRIELVGAVRGCSYKAFLGCKPREFRGTEDAVATLQWFEKIESVFKVSHCAEEDQVIYATNLFEGKALTWWNSVVRIQGRNAITLMTWENLKVLMKKEYVPIHELQRLEQELWNLTMQGSDIRGYTNRFYDLCVLVPRLVRTEEERRDRFVAGLPQSIKDHVLTVRPGTLQSAIEIACTLTESMVQGGLLLPSVVKKDSDEADEGDRSDSKKRSRDPDPDSSNARVFAIGGSGGQNKRPKCGKCGGTHHVAAACWVCKRCKKLGHTERFCKIAPGACFECGEHGHFRDQCTKKAEVVLQLEG